MRTKLINYLLVTLTFILPGIQISWSQVYESKTTQLSQWNNAGTTYSDIWGYAAGGREYAILGSSNYIYFFDVTNPGAPTVIKQFGPYTSTSWREFKTYSHYAYAVSEVDNGGLRIFDLQYLPDSVHFVRQTNAFFNTCHMPFIDENNGRLYCAGTNSQRNGIIVLDLVSRPDSPSVVINEALPGGYVHDMYVRNNIMYASHGPISSISIYNCTGATCGSELNRYTTGGYNHSSWINADGSFLVNAVESGGYPLYLIPLSSSTSFEPAGIKKFKSLTLREQYPNGNAADTNNIAHNPYFVGNLVYSSYYTDGVQIFDVSNPNNIRRIAYFDTDRDYTSYSNVFRGCWGVYPFLPSGNILASDIQSGMWIFRLNSSALPIKKLDLEGALSGHSINIHLSTIVPQGYTQMVLEKSIDGYSFKKLKDITAWNENILFEDNAIDHHIQSENYYRIKLINAAGLEEFSQTIKVEAAFTRFEVYPNPVQSEIYFHSPKPIDLVEIFEMSGRLIFQSKQVESGIILPGAIRNGVYTLHARSGSQNWYHKIIVSK